jgi:diguanylate cyclase (GGDEF)-like protein
VPAAPVMAEIEGTIHVLLIDDNPHDAELCLMALRRAKLAVESVTVSDEQELRAGLLTFVPDVILCDLNFPNFDGLSAQRIVREICGDTPLIFVSGSISEDLAVLALQSGAVDYVSKMSLTRLPSAVQRAVRAARLAAYAEARAREHSRRLEALWVIANNAKLRGLHLIAAILREAGSTLGPPLMFRGMLGRIENDEVVGISIGLNPDAGDTRGNHIVDGIRTPLSDTIIPRVGRTQGWRDIRVIGDIPAKIEAMEWRSVMSTQFNAGGSRYSLTFACTQVAPKDFCDEDFAYVDVVASTFARELEVNHLEDSLRDEEQRSRQHAERLEALWAIVNDSHLTDAEKWLAMLEQAAASIAPGRAYRGMLWRVHEPDVTLEAVAEVPGNLLGPCLPSGAVLPIAGTVVGKVLAQGGGTRSWDDISSSPDATERTREQGARSFVITTFPAGDTTWSLTFTSGSTPKKPLGPMEHAYIEVLASFFANNVQQRTQADRIRYQATHDALTGLINRAEFQASAQRLADRTPKYAIIKLDVNAFHEVNETYGHTMGDALLVEVAIALEQCAVEGEIVGRVGGDVFAVCVGDPHSKDAVRERARDFSNVFVRLFSTGERKKKRFISRSASLGVAFAPEDGETVDAVMSHADAALGAAKERGQGFTVFYEAGMERDAPRRAALRTELAEALANQQFTMFYQPHLELSTGIVTGCEALIRWNHPDRGLVLPGEFIPFAEQAGIITAIDAWVMHQAFAAAGELSALRPGFRVYFNLSGRQAGDPKLVRTFINAARIGVSLESIGVEITETDAMRDFEATRRVFRALRRLGVRTAIDDFGTGYSSLSSLKRLPLDILKIDRSFVAGVTNDTHDAAIAETIISIAARFGFESLAEGAEKPQQLGWLRRHGCRYVQGYGICKPMPMDRFKVWLSERDTGPQTGQAV